jgi:hypothetical protein
MNNCQIYRLILSLFIITISIITFVIISSTIQLHQVFARCPNGTHKSPSGDCEQVVSHGKLPRCPNGYHRSPDGDCEQVSGSHDNGNDNNNGAFISDKKNDLSSKDTIDNANLSETPFASSLTKSVSNGCDNTLWRHVYNPTRLQVVSPCKSVLGVIESKRVERDGDYHIRIKPDAQFSNLINNANIKNQFGDLVVEPICVNPVTQLDAISACQNFHQRVNIPPIGSHVNITGSYVLDKEHGNWAEIHPVTSIMKIQ